MCLCALAYPYVGVLALCLLDKNNKINIDHNHSHATESQIFVATTISIYRHTFSYVILFNIHHNTEAYLLKGG